MGKLLIKNGRVVDGASNRDEATDLLIEDGKIVAMGANLSDATAEVFDATGKVVMPGAVDLHVHLRDLDQAHKETVATGTAAALKGGVTTLFAMANTVPRLDGAEVIKKYQQIIAVNAVVETHVVGGITQKLEGKALAPIEDYPALGIKAISDDGYDVRDEAVLEEAYAVCQKLDLLLITHPEMHDMAVDGVMNEGSVSAELGVPGQPSEKEWKAVERGVKLALKYKVRAHFTHLTCSESVDLIREAKKQSDLITADVTPHHIMLTDEILRKIGGMGKVNPPLRTEADRQALIEGIKDGTVDCIVTDHAPHSLEEKQKPIPEAAFGFTGLETMIPVTITELHHKQGMPLVDVIGLLTSAPAGIVQIDRGQIREGATANLTIVDLDAEKAVEAASFASKGKNTPFEGMLLKGWPETTVYRGTLYSPL